MKVYENDKKLSGTIRNGVRPRRPVYVAVFCHSRGDPHESAAVRRFIKACLRWAGLKCIDIAEVPNPDKSESDTQPTGGPMTDVVGNMLVKVRQFPEGTPVESRWMDVIRDLGHAIESRRLEKALLLLSPKRRDYVLDRMQNLVQELQEVVSAGIPPTHHVLAVAWREADPIRLMRRRQNASGGQP